ncbi:hypothetical protein RND71_021720 [Anisodus tanguticus]|uniref:Uncharacterized protein n=1 Tax=Anisodus tanguticus TaxID=243964 RepID=A0AAE1RX25_9SOLA|nr:hypothetical protein RND71_021720 [Anisodus tanguticus]
MTLDKVNIERDGLKEKVKALEAMKFFEVNKAMNLKEKVLKMKMCITMLFRICGDDKMKRIIVFVF